MKVKLTVMICLIFIGLTHAFAVEKSKQNSEMDNVRLGKLIKKFDGKSRGKPGFWVIEYKGYHANIITDEKANRMRIIVQLSASNELKKEHLYRLMQANFDSALDARYAIAQETVWSTFIHPLSSLSDKDFVSGLAQTITLAATYGTTFSSGALIFKGGDSKQEQQKYYQDIIEKANMI